MLGGKCPFYNTCGARKSSGFQAQYCNSDTKSRSCPERPMNYNDDKVAQKFKYAKSSHESTRFGQGIVVAFIIFVAVVFILSKTGACA